MDACIISLTINFKKGIGALASIVSMLFVLQVSFFLLFGPFLSIIMESWRHAHTFHYTYIIYIHTYICIYIIYV